MYFIMAWIYFIFHIYVFPPDPKNPPFLHNAYLYIFPRACMRYRYVLNHSLIFFYFSYICLSAGPRKPSVFTQRLSFNTTQTRPDLLWPHGPDQKMGHPSGDRHARRDPVRQCLEGRGRAERRVQRPNARHNGAETTHRRRDQRVCHRTGNGNGGANGHGFCGTGVHCSSCCAGGRKNSL